MDYKLLVDTAVLAGEIMLKNGAETYRVEDTIRRILSVSGLKRRDVFVVSTGIIVTLSDPSIDAITLVRRIEEKNTNLAFIAEINTISRSFCNQEMTLEEAFQAIKKVPSRSEYSRHIIYACIVIATCSFTLLLGGKTSECLFAGINGLIIVLFRMLNRSGRVNGFAINMSVCFVIALTSQVFVKLPWFQTSLEPLIAGSIMPLVPGVAITNAIRDTLQGDFMSGTARTVEAFVIAASIAAGVGGGLACGMLLFGNML